MALKEKLMEDMKSAMKEKDLVKKNTIQFVRAAILQVEKDNKVTLDDEGITEILAKEVKKRKDSLPEYEKSGRQDLIDTLNREIEIILAYLPKQLTKEELTVIVKEAVEAVGAKDMKDMGKIMGYVLPKIKGVGDGKTVNEIAKEILS
ncbi:GatB/YqeY domain-containing protein [Acetivibrio sp. MSJd-27]|jgi:gatB/yqeY|uniref:GatB/YqeY domain-containing protein n=1 Tax=Acetivibrio sp. MSJd-27 TaxID=2841523 RepID=UPI0015AB24D7|nr:GatB/YqeY domain-containing protein [Acetivibrio sp. MSJd-27]MBU5449927.1 GatB/YqeY domain-containing protein [Acetivibrio sp. MSJd-27]